MGKTLLIKTFIFYFFSVLGDLGPNNHIWSFGYFWVLKYVFGHILLENDHLIVIEGFLEVYWVRHF